MSASSNIKWDLSTPVSIATNEEWIEWLVKTGSVLTKIIAYNSVERGRAFAGFISQLTVRELPTEDRHRMTEVLREIYYKEGPFSVKFMGTDSEGTTWLLGTREYTSKTHAKDSHFAFWVASKAAQTFLNTPRLRQYLTYQNLRGEPFTKVREMNPPGWNRPLQFTGTPFTGNVTQPTLPVKSVESAVTVHNPKALTRNDNNDWMVVGKHAEDENWVMLGELERRG